MHSSNKLFSSIITALCLSCTLDASAMEISENPLTIISGPESGLKRPEGASFSPSGDCMAIADSECNAILLYKYTGNDDNPYEGTPITIIKDNDLLNYVHDLEFSPSGEFIAGVSRESNTVVIYKKQDDPYSFDAKPFWFMRGSESKLNNPASLSFSKNGKVLAVCNRMGGSGITFYNQSENSLGEFSPIPFQCLTEISLMKNNISAPHGMGFSPDGKSIVVVHKPYYKDNKRPGEEAIAVYDFTESPVASCNPEPIYFELKEDISLHSVAFHPSGRYFATVSEEGTVDFYQKMDNSTSYFFIKTLKTNGKGKRDLIPKGIDFSPNGSFLAITFETPAIHIFEVSDY